MKKIQKVLISFLFVIMTILSACSQSNNDNKADLTKKGTTQEITFLYESDENAVDKEKESIYIKAKEKFQQDHPNTTIKIEKAKYANYTKELDRRASDGTLPDIITVWAQDVSEYNEKGYLTDLGPYIKTDNLNENTYFYNKFNQIFTSNGKLLGIPYFSNNIGVYYNKAWFDRAGLPYPKETWTWGDFEEISSKLKASNSVNNKDVYGAIFPFGLEFIEPLVMSLGSDILSPEGLKSEGYLNNKDAVKSVSWVYDFIHNKNLSPVSTTGVWRDDINKFTSGTAGMLISFSGYATNNINPQLTSHMLDKSYGYVALPHFPEGKRVSSGYAIAMGINPKSKNALLAWNFLRYITIENNEFTRQLAGGGWIAPKEAYKSIYTENPLRVLYGDELEYMLRNSYSKIKEWYTIHLKINSTDMSTLIKTDNPNIQESMNQIVKNVDKLIDNRKSLQLQ